MKARIKGTDAPFTEIDMVQLKDSDILYKADVMEFEHDTISTELHTYDQVQQKVTTNEIMQDYWTWCRHQAAIAAMQGLLSNPGLLDHACLDYRISVIDAANSYANELVEQLKKKQQ